MALDSVTSSGREPSMSLMDGSAPESSRSSTMSANSQADALEGGNERQDEESGGGTSSKKEKKAPTELTLPLISAD